MFRYRKVESLRAYNFNHQNELCGQVAALDWRKNIYFFFEIFKPRISYKKMSSLKWTRKFVQMRAVTIIVATIKEEIRSINDKTSTEKLIGKRNCTKKLS